MTRKQRRLILIGSALGVLFVAAGLTMFALRDNIVFFYTPSEIAAKAPAPGTRLRLGGLVRQGSVVRGADRAVSFEVVDGERHVSVSYKGLLPDLFREGQGVVAEGVLVSPTEFRADNVLAKHDETYMPREVADALKKQGHWQPDGKLPNAEAKSAQQ